MFNQRGRKPWASVNFVTAHDGFTLNDLVSYNDKHNEANGEDNRDGHRTTTRGTTAPRVRPTTRILALRERQKRNFLATLLLSQGTPMLLAGDEFGRTPARQQQRLLPGQRDQLGRLGRDRRRGPRAARSSSASSIALRTAFPILRRSRFLTGEYNEELGVKDVTWLTPAGTR